MRPPPGNDQLTVSPPIAARPGRVPNISDSIRISDTPAGGQTICVGRETELSALLGSYDQARSDGSLLTVVHGDAGAGKSRVLNELGRRLRLEGCPVLEGRAEPGRPFGAFASIVERALRFLGEVSAGPQVDLSDLSCGEGCHSFWYQHEGSRDELPGLRLDSGRFGPAKVMERRMRFFDAVGALLREVATVRTPLILLHDLDRADQGTADLLVHLLEGASWHGLVAGEQLPSAGAFFVASCRAPLQPAQLHTHGEEMPVGPSPEEDVARALGSADANATPDMIQTLLRHPATATVELGPLDAEGVRAYLQAPETIAQILERTQGVPERLDLLLQAHPLTPEESLQRRRLELPEGAQVLLDVLSVLGHSGDIDTLSRVAETRPDPASLAALRESQLVSTEVLDGRVLLSFKRESERERAYYMLSAERRRALHLRFSDAFAGCLDAQRVDATELDARAGNEQAARHALLAGDIDRALPLAVAAARSLAARHAHSEAAALLEELPPETLSAGHDDLLAELSELHRMAGNYPRALHHASALRERRPTDSAVCRRVGDLLTQAGNLRGATQALEQARSLAREAQDEGATARAEALLAELHYQRAAYADAERSAEAALSAAEADVALEVHARNTLGKVALAQRDSSLAADLFEHNRALASKHGLGHAEAQALTNLGVSRLRQQDFDGARDAFEHAIDVAGHAGDTRDHAIATENLAVLAHLRRDAKSALKRYHEAISQLKRLGNRAMLARVANNLGELYLSLGDGDRARSLCDFATHMGGIHMSPAIAAEGLLLRGRVELMSDALTEARASFEAAWKGFDAIGEERRIDASLELVRVALAEGRVAEADADICTLRGLSLGPKREAELALRETELDRAAGRPAMKNALRACALAEAAHDPQRLLPALLHRCRAQVEAGDTTAALHDLARAREVELELTANVPDSAMSSWHQRPIARVLTELEERLSSSQSSPSGHRSVRPSRPPRAIARGTEHQRLRELFPDLVGSSAPMAAVRTILEKVAPADTMVLIRGESGTGKEVVAEALHQHSSRHAHPIVKVNCAALVETLLLSELFGHERGAFTGATSRKKGRFELADGGTIFLDEIGDISPKTQVALLRVLQERRFERVGGTQPVEVDVRIIAATHRDLEEMVRQGTFREDLYYRLRGVMVELPPLRERPDDLAELSEHLLARIAADRGDTPKRLSEDGARLLATHGWPGNVRELDNVLRSATLFSDTLTLDATHFDAFAGSFSGGVAPGGDSRSALARGDAPRLPSASEAPSEANLEDLLYTRVRAGELSLLDMKKTLERECIARAIRETDGNITQAANLLGMKRPRLSQLVKQYGLLDGSSKRTS